ncbi:MlaE family lipid ABC transporter permease subunit [Paracoccus sp. YIM 132242]|uniref:MlaE family lipid ABC transporter permease subunit n=1 Tax=Paracoccus lichenicola TaxID=2665644 RepID=A0A6L6HP95_9RHOB|nr:ABC transporter permease [Paracoccus lichenicola]MTE00269.1 MlaE family lipid ABC transporter permease subunit [Paracoccus lichenicola]
MTVADAALPDLSVKVVGHRAILSGHLVVWTLGKLSDTPDAAGIDLAGVVRMDTAGAWELARRRAAGGTLTGLSDHHAGLLATVTRALPVPDPAVKAPPWWSRILDGTGRRVAGALAYLGELTEYLGRTLAALGRGLRHLSRFPATSLIHHCQETGLRAVPIVAVMSFLIGVVLAFQGSDQLRQFGAEVFVVDLIAISILRELGILLTAIIVAGRTASALTASIGSMKMRQEIDAMRTLGLDPDLVLVLPRVLALVLMLPILGLVSALTGLLGGAVMSWIELGISPAVFVARLADVSVSHAVVGLIKAPVFALIIGVIGCHAGMRVGQDAESLGRMTSSAVVSAIFAVIIADAAFSVFFAQVGL